jgi:tetratricopeptide (TPR) repeat protein
VALERQGDLAAALDAYRAAQERARGQPLDEAQALHNAGRALLGAGRLEEAEAALRGATERAPGVAEMAYALAYVLDRRGDLASAETWAARTLAVDPRHFGAAQMLGMLRVRSGRVDDGIALLTLAARLAPGSPGTLADLGTALERGGRVAEACAAWRNALRLGPEMRLAARVRGQMAAVGCPPD